VRIIRKITGWPDKDPARGEHATGRWRRFGRLAHPDTYVSAEPTVQQLTQYVAQVQALGIGGADVRPAARNAWLGDQSRAQEERAAGEAAAGAAVPWTPVEESPGRARARRAAQIGLGLVLVLAVVSGVRSWFRHEPKPYVPPVSAAQQFPGVQAGAVAGRFTESWWTWDDTAPDQHAAAVALDYTGDAGTGWAGHGKQSAADAAPWSVTVESATRARVTVIAYVTPYTQDQKTRAYTAGPGKWRALDVPVQVTGQRVSVAGTPAEVGLPAPQSGSALNLGDSDDALTNSTKADVTSFFTAYGKSTDVSALVAPGAQITGLGSGLVLNALTSWTVYAGTPSTRTAAAVVRWQEPGGNLSSSAYSLSLTKVSGASGDRWQVLAITGKN
jgi:Conjugative transposon protein TcpC